LNGQGAARLLVKACFTILATGSVRSRIAGVPDTNDPHPRHSPAKFRIAVATIRKAIERR